MNNNVIIGVVVVVAIVGAVLGINLVSDDNDGESANDNANTTQNTTTNNTTTINNPIGVDLSSLNGNYRITVTEEKDGQSNVAVLETDDMGNTKTATTVNGKTTNLIYHDKMTYTQNPDTQEWVKFPSTESSDEVNTGYSQDEIENIDQDAEVKELGDRSCSSGTCRAYEVTDMQDGKSTILVDKGTNRLTQVVIEDPQSTVTIDYEYPNVVIEPPAEFTEFQIPDIS